VNSLNTDKGYACAMLANREVQRWGSNVSVQMLLQNSSLPLMSVQLQ
jgi:hypothetical protein